MLEDTERSVRFPPKLAASDAAAGFEPLRTLEGDGKVGVMRPLWILLGVPSLLSACATSDAQQVRDPWTAAPPSERLVDHIEDLLAEDTCVGNIKRWARLYEWGLTKNGLDTSVVEIDLRQVGVFGFTPGRLIRSRDPSLGPGEIMVHADDRDYRFASGSYDVKTGKLELRFCGRNCN